MYHEITVYKIHNFKVQNSITRWAFNPLLLFMNFHVRNWKTDGSVFHPLYSPSIQKYSQIIQVTNFLPHHHHELIFYICLKRLNFLIWVLPHMVLGGYHPRKIFSSPPHLVLSDSVKKLTGCESFNFESLILKDKVSFNASTQFLREFTKTNYGQCCLTPNITPPNSH